MSRRARDRHALEHKRMIHFSSELGWWSVVTFWIVVVSIILNLGFTLVVMVGGIRDLRFLLKSMDEARDDEQDDGRVVDSTHDSGSERT